MHKRVLVAGSLNIDFVFKTDRLPKKGESLHGADFSIFPGGKGANQAVAIARLGGAVDIVGRIGRDVFGSMLVNGLKKNRVGTENIIIDDKKRTGTALIVVDRNGDNSILVAQGANFNWSENDVDLAEPLVKSAACLLLQLEISFSALKSLKDIARSHDVPVILDAGPARPIEQGFLDGLDIVSPNQTEAEALTGHPVTNIQSAARAARRLMSAGVINVVMKLGEKGCLVVNDTTELYIPAVSVGAVDTTAAGDAFTGALAFFISRGLAITEAARFSNYAGALAVTKMGAQPSLPKAEEVRELLKANGYDFAFS